MIQTRVTVADMLGSYPALVDPADLWNGWLSPLFTLDTVRHLAADTQAAAARYGDNSVDTIHVLDGGTDDNGQPEAVVMHIAWQWYSQDSGGAVETVTPTEDGLYAIGGGSWTWTYADKPQDGASVAEILFAELESAGFSPTITGDSGGTYSKVRLGDRSNLTFTGIIKAGDDVSILHTATDHHAWTASWSDADEEQHEVLYDSSGWKVRFDEDTAMFAAALTAYARLHGGPAVAPADHTA